jgi:hypothetical protein
MFHFHPSLSTRAAHFRKLQHASLHRPPIIPLFSPLHWPAHAAMTKRLGQITPQDADRALKRGSDVR